MLDNLRHRLLQPINSATTVLLGIYTVLWGVYLMLPVSTFDSAFIFDTLNDAAPEPVWGLVAAVVGVALIYGAVKPSYRSLMLSTGFSSLFWLFIGIALFAADPSNTGGLTYIFIATLCAYAYLNIKVNHDLGHDWSN